MSSLGPVELVAKTKKDNCRTTSAGIQKPLTSVGLSEEEAEGKDKRTNKKTPITATLAGTLSVIVFTKVSCCKSSKDCHEIPGLLFSSYGSYSYNIHGEPG